MEYSNVSRSRNLWSAEEDETLRQRVESYEKDKVDWRRIASCLPGRNNKDCRKRWHYRVSPNMNLGPWSTDEDELLRTGIHRCGTHWSRVAQIVGTRNECFKRWNDVLSPSIDHSPWTREADRMLLLAVRKYGRSWKHVVDTHFPRRTGLDAKNRHRQLTRKRKRGGMPDVLEDLEQSPQTSMSILPSSPQPQMHEQTQSVQPEYVVNSTAIAPEPSSSLLEPLPIQHVNGRSLSAPSYSDWKFDGFPSPALSNMTPYTSRSDSPPSLNDFSLFEYNEYLSPQPVGLDVCDNDQMVFGVVADGYPYLLETPNNVMIDAQQASYGSDLVDFRQGMAPFVYPADHVFSLMDGM